MCMQHIERFKLKSESMKKAAFLLVMVFLLSAINAQKAFEKTDSLAKAMESIPKVSFQPFSKGERLEYLVHYGFVDAGTATIQVINQDYKIGEKDVLRVVGTGRSQGAFDWFFKVRDTYESYIDPEDMKPYVFKRDISEGGYKFKQHYQFFHDENKVKDNRKNEEVAAPSGIQDMISAYYFARTIDLEKYNIGDVIEFQAFVDGKVEPLKIRFLGKEKVKVESGTFQCLKFQPLVQKGRIFDDEEDLTVYITDDKNRIPVLAKANVLVGSIKMELTSYKGISHPIAKVKS